jgi:hypothetical protein
MTQPASIGVNVRHVPHQIRGRHAVAARAMSRGRVAALTVAPPRLTIPAWSPHNDDVISKNTPGHVQGLQACEEIRDGRERSRSDRRPGGIRADQPASPVHSRGAGRSGYSPWLDSVGPGARRRGSCRQRPRPDPTELRPRRSSVMRTSPRVAITRPTHDPASRPRQRAAYVICRAGVASFSRCGATARRDVLNLRDGRHGPARRERRQTRGQRKQWTRQREADCGPSRDPVAAETPLELIPESTFDQVPHPFGIVVPGGGIRTIAAMGDEALLGYLGAAVIESVQLERGLLRRARLMHFDVIRCIRRGAWS